MSEAPSWKPKRHWRPYAIFGGIVLIVGLALPGCGVYERWLNAHANDATFEASIKYDRTHAAWIQPVATLPGTAKQKGALRSPYIVAGIGRVFGTWDRGYHWWSIARSGQPSAFNASKAKDTTYWPIIGETPGLVWIKTFDGLASIPSAGTGTPAKAWPQGFQSTVFAVDPTGIVYGSGARGALNNVVWRLTPDGKFVRKWAVLNDIVGELSVGPHGTVYAGRLGYVKAKNAYRVDTISRSGKVSLDAIDIPGRVTTGNYDYTIDDSPVTFVAAKGGLWFVTYEGQLFGTLQPGWWVNYPLLAGNRGLTWGGPSTSIASLVDGTLWGVGHNGDVGPVDLPKP